MLRSGTFSRLSTALRFTRAGQNWRVSQGLGRSGNESGELHDHNDWSFADGTPAPITPKQKQWMNRKETQRQRIAKYLDTANIKEEKPRPILPKSE